MPAWKAMDFPNPDYVVLARACGAVGFKAEKPDQLREAMDEAFKAEGPAIIDCVVPADELPNLPHIELEKIANVAKAKVKEAILAGDRWVRADSERQRDDLCESALEV
jgi:pyruvate dehydrogenase (quinone)